jgi:hypothetical protein
MARTSRSRWENALLGWPLTIAIATQWYSTVDVGRDVGMLAVRDGNHWLPIDLGHAELVTRASKLRHERS